MISNGAYHEPETVEEMAQLVRSAEKLTLRRNDSDTLLFRLPGEAKRFGYDKRTAWISTNDDQWSTSTEWGFEEIPEGFTRISSESLREIMSFEPADQVVHVQADIPFGNLNAELAEQGQCIPLPPWEDGISIWNSGGDSIGSLISMNMPHALQAQCGSWRDWILGVTVVLADGTIARSGSKAVKNVAGYDVHKWMVGTRDTLAVLVDVTLKTFPLHALPKTEVERPISAQEAARRQGELGSSFWWIQRTLRSDWEQALQNARDHLVAADHASQTLYAIVPESEALPRFAHDWVMRSGCGPKNFEVVDPVQIKLMKSAKEVFDPTHKLNPGEMGIF